MGGVGGGWGVGGGDGEKGGRRQAIPAPRNGAAAPPPLRTAFAVAVRGDHNGRMICRAPLVMAYLYVGLIARFSSC